MDSQTLNAFIAVVEAGSFSEAAENLYLTQPAVSKRIQSLEQHLGVSLFHRHRKNLALTDAGSTFLPNARNILREIENAEIDIQNLKEEVSGSLRVISSHHIGLHRLPPIIKGYLNRYPNVDLNIEFMESETAYDKIVKNQADIAFMTEADEIDSANLIEHFAWSDPMNFVCSTEHPLSQLNEPYLGDLAAHKAILPQKSTYTYALLEDLFKQHQLNLQSTIPTNYLETIKMLMVTGLGWTVLPNTMIDEFVHVVQIEDVRIERKLAAVSHKQHRMSHAANAFLEEAKKVWTD